MLSLEYLPTPTARAWRRSSLQMHPEGRPNMERTAAALALQDGWHAWRITGDEPDSSTLEGRRELCARPCTLNGRPAAIGGALEAFATVRDRETGLGAQWAWPTVARVLERGGDFYS